MNTFVDYFKEEPARVIEAARAILFILPALGIVLGAPVVSAILTVVSLLTSILLQEKGVRAHVSPLRETPGESILDDVIAEYDELNDFDAGADVDVSVDADASADVDANADLDDLVGDVIDTVDDIVGK